MDWQTILFILSLILLTAVVYFNHKYRKVKASRKSPAEILQERYVKGKISKYEYDIKMRDVERDVEKAS